MHTHTCTGLTLTLTLTHACNMQWFAIIDEIKYVTRTILSLSLTRGSSGPNVDMIHVCALQVGFLVLYSDIIVNKDILQC